MAAVFQRLNQSSTNMFTLTDIGRNKTEQLGQTNMESMSFFKTFMSNDDYMRSAENFIKKYREHQQMNNTQNSKNLPLQLVNDHYST